VEGRGSDADVSTDDLNAHTLSLVASEQAMKRLAFGE
jgi:hypothetical protein